MSYLAVGLTGLWIGHGMGSGEGAPPSAPKAPSITAPADRGQEPAEGPQEKASPPDKAFAALHDGGGAGQGDGAHPPSRAGEAKATALEVETLARTIYGEARGEPFEGQIAVGYVIRNRAELGGWWGNSIIEVARNPSQFQVWDREDPNYRKMLAVGLDNPAFRQCYRAALYVLESPAHKDPTGGATHYHLRSQVPSWARKGEQTLSIENHVFYKII